MLFRLILLLLAINNDINNNTNLVDFAVSQSENIKANKILTNTWSLPEN